MVVIRIRSRTGSGRLRGDGALAQFVRFVLVGGSSNITRAILVVAVSAGVGVFRFLALRGWVFS
ncbi:hypothetical protein FK531_11645 [Rhodococcus spelaei]|uniref:Uncharacterized protein n=1 Tax=Rhodococcus spelaei TaxID=2546320 RepID=A0A541BAN0_9NOCA|nr:hypothetical protein [Rhodococcus spelaei]TQF69377.1 hypothetical protein FK531_11645 [Rhodococcus spelaei]